MEGERKRGRMERRKEGERRKKGKKKKFKFKDIKDYTVERATNQKPWILVSSYHLLISDLGYTVNFI